MLSNYSWTDSTWINRVTQLRKWLSFCNEECGALFPASEVDGVSYIFFLPLEGLSGPRSAQQYVKNMLWYEDAAFASHTKTRLVTFLV